MLLNPGEEMAPFFLRCIRGEMRRFLDSDCNNGVKRGEHFWGERLKLHRFPGSPSPSTSPVQPL